MLGSRARSGATAALSGPGPYRSLKDGLLLSCLDPGLGADIDAAAAAGAPDDGKGDALAALASASALAGGPDAAAAVRLPPAEPGLESVFLSTSSRGCDAAGPLRLFRSSPTPAASASSARAAAASLRRISAMRLSMSSLLRGEG